MSDNEDDLEADPSRRRRSQADDDDDYDYAPRRRKSDGRDLNDSHMNGRDWVLAIMCGPIGFIIGIIYLIQGKPKGGMMLGISLIFNMIGLILLACAGFG